MGERILYSVWSVPGVSRAWESVYRKRRSKLMKRVVEQRGPVEAVEFDGWSVSYALANTGDFTQYWSATQQGGYERATTILLKDLLKPGGTFVDVGANIGYYTAEASFLVGPLGRVYAFEPNPTTYSRLKGNIEANGVGGRAQAYNSALSDASSRVRLYLAGDDDAIGSMVRETRDSIEVEAVPGDEILAGQSVDVIKIDVEGAELLALRGLKHTLEANATATLIVEWNRPYRTEELWRALSTGYRVARVRETDAGYELVQLRTYSDARRLPLCNLLCYSG